jgi:hypothetical protein
MYQAVKDYAKDWSHSLSGTMRRLILAEYGKQGGADKKPNSARQDKKGKKATLDPADAEAEPKEEKKEKRAEKDEEEDKEAAVDEVVDEDIEEEDGEEEAEQEGGMGEAKQPALKRKNKRLPKEVQEREAAEMRLHDKRHAFILGWLHSIYGRSDTPYIVGTPSSAHAHAHTHTHTRCTHAHIPATPPHTSACFMMWFFPAELGEQTMDARRVSCLRRCTTRCPRPRSCRAMPTRLCSAGGCSAKTGPFRPCSAICSIRPLVRHHELHIDDGTLAVWW